MRCEWESKRNWSEVIGSNYGAAELRKQPVIEEKSLVCEAAIDLLRSIERIGVNLSTIDRVVSPAVSGITLANFCADYVSDVFRPSVGKPLCQFAFVDTAELAYGVKEHVFGHTKVYPGHVVLLMDDILRTGRTMELTTRAMLAAGGRPYSVVGVLANDSGLAYAHTFGRREAGPRIISLVDSPRLKLHDID